jgi:hypothetical protein
MFKEVWNGPSSIMFKKGWDTSETGLCCRCSKKKAGTPGRSWNGELFQQEGWNGSLKRARSSMVMGKWDSKIMKLTVSHVVMGLKKIE